MNVLRMPIKRKTAPLKPKQEIKGLGDMVARIAEPVKAVLPNGIRKHLSNCGCQKRRELLNKLVPFKT